MIDEHLIRLRELASMTGAPTWIPSAIVEIEQLRSRVEQLEHENGELSRQLEFFRRRVAA